MPLPSLEQESDLPMSLSYDLTPHTSSPKDVPEDVLISSDPPTTLNDFCEFQEGEDFENLSELDVSVTLKLSIMLSQTLCLYRSHVRR